MPLPKPKSVSLKNYGKYAKYMGMLLVMGWVIGMATCSHRSHSDSQFQGHPKLGILKPVNAAAQDSAAESLNTLTAELSTTQQQIQKIVSDNEMLKQQNQTLLTKLSSNPNATAALSQQVAELKSKLQNLSPYTQSKQSDSVENSAQPITTVPEISEVLSDPDGKHWHDVLQKISLDNKNNLDKKPDPIPYYTIPANATSVEDRLMSPLIGRIPVKGVVTDPYPFKLVFSDDTLAANGLRVPGLKQLVVSGYTEGDLNLSSARGWVTSLTFVFNDGRISTTTSNDNNIGKYSKENALGYLSDEYGNPAIRGKLITNAPAYLGINVALGAAQGAASAYAQAQTTSNSTLVGTSTSDITGSQSAYVTGQAVNNAANQVQQWWQDREANSFDAIFVSTLKTSGEPQKIVVNFSKEIHIDYDPIGRKIVYAHPHPNAVFSDLD